MSGGPPVRPTDRVSDVLARDESLVEVFARHSPHFEKLRHRSMRRVMARLVTVEQAAGICGAAADVLVRDLNRALGIGTAEASRASADADASGSAPASGAVEAPAFAPGTLVTEVDVRDDLRNGREPFSRIMAAVGSLPADGVLHLRAPFEPVPLFTVMAKRGFAHVARRNGPDEWSVWFQRATTASPPESAAAEPSAAPRAAANEIVLDVRGMEPPDPMIRTLEALEHLPPGATLLQINARVPQFLLPVLVERGFTYQLDTSNPQEVRVRIGRAPGDDFSPVSEPSTETLMDNDAVVLDVRPIPGRDKHPTIFRTFDALAPGKAMLLVNDHDPRPLRYQFMAERPDAFDWRYEEEGPEVWKVRIARKE